MPASSAARHPRQLACLPGFACRWPIDDPGAGRMHLALFCADPRDGVGPYCAAHASLAYRQAKAEAP